MYFIFRPVSTTGTFMYSFRSTVGYDTTLNGIYGELPSNFPILYGGVYRLYTSVQGYALGIPPVVYNASSSNVSCSTFDIGCYFSQALSYAFYPTEWTFDRLTEINTELASSSPFGYAYEVYDIADTALSTTSQEFALELDLSDFGPVFQTATSVAIVSSVGIRDFIGTTMWTIVQNLMALAFYLILLSYFWYRFREIV